MRIALRSLVLVVPILCSPARPAQADLLYFAKGGRVEAEVVRDGRSIEVVTPAGKSTFELSDFSKIVPRPSTRAEWEARLSKAKGQPPDARFALAWWGLENGLTPEAVSLIREVHASDPNHAMAARLVRLLDELDREAPDPDLAPIRRDAGGEFKVERGKRALVLHQGDPAGARDRLDVVERVQTTFLLVFAARGIELHPPRSKLVSLWFATQADYLAFLKRARAEAFRNAQGYFHPTHNLVVGFEATEIPSHKSGLLAIARRTQELDTLGRSIEAMPKGSRLRLATSDEPPRTMNRPQAQQWLTRARRDLDRPRLILELDRRAVDLGLTAHESVHQLVALSDLLPDYDAFPTWLHEGLAAQFEVVRGGRWAGFSRANDQRLPDWRSLNPPPRLAPILRDEGFRNGYNRTLYAQAWSLVYFLRLQHPDKFITFLDRLRSSPSPRKSDNSPILEAFRTTFGDLPELEFTWHRFLRDVSSPLDEFDPSRKTRPIRD